ncbi:hypothetical protein [Skermania piniformis]|uniref:Histidine kinase n=1 Tax=Skermania pinensis TaxID=39122 RepID=A0ABX8S582_9ACTN|nr:hypothetical protein [Skermania piniformis]QXQ12611.1 hypothetical protein KV203_11615 [Skermania piniformis]
MHRAPDRPGVGTLIGLDGWLGLVLLSLLEAIVLLLATRDVGTTGGTPAMILGYVLIALAGCAVVLPSGDPLPARYTAGVAAIGPVAIFLSTRTPPDRPLTVIAAPIASGLVLGLLSVRGRAGPAWASAVAIVSVTVLVGWSAGLPSASVAGAIGPVGTVGALTVFAAIIRPTQRSLYELRVETTTVAVANAAMRARLEERDRQLARLDRAARLMLERIAAGKLLDDTDRIQCRLLEAELRDGLRAPNLAIGELAAAAREARGRGVEVLLLDDGGFAAVSPQVRDVVVSTAAWELDAVGAGSVTVRVLPAGRRIVASVLVAEPGQDRRTEIDGEGLVQTTVDVYEYG